MCLAVAGGKECKVNMKRKIKLNYKSIFKYDDHHETVKYNAKGIYEKDDQKERITFFQDDIKIEILIRKQDVLLTHGKSTLCLTPHKKIYNQYLTEYGMIDLYTELIILEHERHIKLKYVLYDESQKISDVYILVNYEVME